MTLELIKEVQTTIKTIADKIPDFFKSEFSDDRKISDMYSKIPDFARSEYSAFEVNQDEHLKVAEKEKILESSPYTESINNSITSKAELDIYTSTGLEEKKIGNKDALCRSDIELEKIDDDGLSNLDRMNKGRPPLDVNNKPIELHHIGQDKESPFAELTQSEHRGQGNNVILHDGTHDTKIDRVSFQTEKSQYWKARAEQLQKDINL